MIWCGGILRVDGVRVGCGLRWLVVIGTLREWVREGCLFCAGKRRSWRFAFYLMGGKVWEFVAFWGGFVSTILEAGNLVSMLTGVAYYAF